MQTSSGAATTRTIKASEFKAKCLKLMDEVADSGGEIVITKNGRPVSRLVPYQAKAGHACSDAEPGATLKSSATSSRPCLRSGSMTPERDKADEDLFRIRR